MMPEVLYVHSGRETFVSLDQELLTSFARVKDLYVPHKFPRDWLEYWRGVRRSEIVYCWFASWNSFWAILLTRLLRKTSILVVGGYDVANLPEAGYGSQRGGLGRWISRTAMQLADQLIPFSDFSSHEAIKVVPATSPRIRRIYLGVPDPLGSLPAGPRERLALTVGNVEWPNLKRKGLEPFVRTAALLPDVHFVLAGAWKDDSIDYLRSIASPNLSFTGRLSDQKLIDTYKRSSVYIQASLHEGFGLSVAEAMLAGCIPVVTRAGSLPEIVGDCGYICETNLADEIARKIEYALSSSWENRIHTRDRILNGFPVHKRKLALMQLLTPYGI